VTFSSWIFLIELKRDILDAESLIAIINKKWRELAVKRALYKISIYFLVVTITIITLFPFMWMVKTAFESSEEIYKSSSLIPVHPTLSHFKEVLAKTPFLRYFFNSFIVTIPATLFGLIISSHGAYALSRFKFKGKNILASGILFVHMLPAVAIAIPLFKMIKFYHLLDTYFSLIICYTTFSLPFGTWMLKGFFDSIPTELEEAAMIDGCSRMQSFYKILIPLTFPGIAAVTIYAFLLAWSEYLYASIFMQSASMYTLSVGLRTFERQYTADFGLLMAAATIMSIPVFFFFIFVEKFLVQGLTAGAVKG